MEEFLQYYEKDPKQKKSVIFAEATIPNGA